MSNFSQFCRKCLSVSVLVLALASSTFAGDIQYPGITSQPPTTTDGDVQYPNATSTDTVDGDIQYPGVTVVAVSLLESALSLF